MKKFLCYDTNDAASGKIGVDNNGVLSPNATVPSTNGAANQYLVTDSIGNTKWEDRLVYTQTIPGSDGPIITFQAYLNTISPLTLSEPLVVDAPYTVKEGNDEYKTTCTAHGEILNVVSKQGSLVVNDPINNPLIALWNGALTHKKIEIVRESQEEVKQIDPKYIPSKETFFVVSGQGSFRTGTDWYEGEDATIADIVSAYHDGGARIFQMSGGERIGISNVIGASEPGSSSPFITYYDYSAKAVSTTNT